MWSSVEGGTEYELVIGPLTTLTGRMENYGTKVSLQLQPKHRQSYMVYQASGSFQTGSVSAQD